MSIQIPVKLTEAVEQADKDLSHAAPKIDTAIQSSTGQALVADVRSVFGRKGRTIIHTTIGILGTLVAIGGAAGAYFTGDTSLAIGGAVGILSSIESVLSLSHLGDS